MKKEGLWKDENIDPSKLGQYLSLKSEPNAKLDTEVVQKVGHMDGQNFIFDTTSPVKGTFLRATYSNLENSSYAGKRIAKIVIDFSDKKTSDQGSDLVLFPDPTSGWIYNGYEGITADIRFFDEKGNQITFSKDQPAYLSVGSLNNYSGFGDGSVEKVQLLSDGTALQLPESSIRIHTNNILYADKTNELPGAVRNHPNPSDVQAIKEKATQIWGKDIVDKYIDWDGIDNPTRIFGAGLYQVTGDHVTLRSFKDSDGDKNENSNGPWFTYSTTIPQMSFDAEGPQKPTTIIHYHDNEIQVPASITVKYVDQDTGNEIPDTQFNQKGNEGDSITYTTADTISKLQLQGYTLVSDDFTGKAGDKLNEDNNGKTYVVTLKKQNQDKPSNPETKDGTQTYHFVDKNTGKVLTTDKVGGKVGEDVSVNLKVPDGYHLVKGQTVPTSANIKDKDNPINILVEKDKTPAKPSTPETKDGTQTIHIIDKKTGNVLTTVVKGGKIGENIPVSLKVPNGYHLVQGQKLPTSVNIKDKDNAINVYVEKDEAKPAVTTPSANSDSKATPAPVENTKSNADTTNISDAKAPSTPVANNTTTPQQQATLPQTGNSSSTAGVVAGSALLATMATLGIAYRKRTN